MRGYSGVVGSDLRLGGQTQAGLFERVSRANATLAKIRLLKTGEWKV